MALASERTIRVTRRFGVAPPALFDAWLDPDMIRKWLAARAKADEVVQVSVDPRPGGRFSFRVRRGADEIEQTGSYVALERPRVISFTWDVPAGGDDSNAPGAGQEPRPGVVRVELAPFESNTVLRLSHEGVPEDYSSRTENAWSDALLALEASFA